MTIIYIYDWMIDFCLNDICWGFVGHFNPSKYVLRDLRVQKLRGFIVLFLFDDPKSIWMCDVEGVGIFKFDVYIVGMI